MAETSDSAIHICVIYGTRPEAIKVAPVIQSMIKDVRFHVSTITTGQHREVVQDVNSLFSIEPTVELDVLVPGAPLTEVALRAWQLLGPAMRDLQPDVVLVQGDTITAMQAALVAFLDKTPVVHLEAGLRTGDLANPFPEEAARKVISTVCSLHLTPTSQARENLIAEGVHRDTILVSGNTVIDALQQTASLDSNIIDKQLAGLTASGRPYVLVTTHRRESWGRSMADVFRAISDLSREYEDIQWLIPLHPNPAIRELATAELGERANVWLTDPLSYVDFVTAMKSCLFVLTDSGGVQEEAPSLGKPVLILRDTTERPEAVSSGTAKLIGTNRAAVVREVRTLIDDDKAYLAMARATNPYGDGRAAARVTAAVLHMFGKGVKPAEFVAAK